MLAGLWKLCLDHGRKPILGSKRKSPQLTYIYNFFAQTGSRCYVLAYRAGAGKRTPIKFLIAHRERRSNQEAESLGSIPFSRRCQRQGASSGRHIRLHSGRWPYSGQVPMLNAECEGSNDREGALLGITPDVSHIGSALDSKTERDSLQERKKRSIIIRN